MRLLTALFASAAFLSNAIASDAPAKPSRQEAAEKSVATGKDSALKEAAAPRESALKPPVRKPESAAAARAREEAMAEEVAARVAARLAEIRREKVQRPVINPAYRQKVASSSRTSSREHSAAALASRESRLEAPTIPAPHAAHWSYEGEGGPIRWGKLNPAWSMCDSGSRQSPIDIRDGIKVDLEPVLFDYKPAGFNVVDNGHTVQVNVGAGNYITIMGRMYELVQFHFHRPSEERINGKGFEMVAHLVHKDAEGRLAVVAVLIERGRPQNVIQSVWNNLPLEKHTPLAAPQPIDMNQLLPTRREYYTFMGSLTTPPCSEGVLWIVLKEPVQASGDQIGIFARLYPMNARPLQAQAGRMIKESN